MSWTDKQAIRVMNYLKKKYKIKTLVETGTYKGDNAIFQSKNFNKIITCEKIKEFYNIAKKRTENYHNIMVINETSPIFLNKLSLGTYMFYLDAHFYDKKTTKKDRFVVLKELDNMKKFKSSIIIIHDFMNGLGGLCYDDIDLDINLVREKLKRINQNFYFYGNILKSVDPVKPTSEDLINIGMQVDYETLNTLNHVWSTPARLYRGLLYCLPTKLTRKEEIKLGVREIK